MHMMQNPGSMPNMGSGSLGGVQFLGNNANQLYVNSEGECLVYELKGRVSSRPGDPMHVMSDGSGLVDPPGLDPTSQLLQPLQSNAMLAHLTAHAGNLASIPGMPAGFNMHGMAPPALNGMVGAHAPQLMWPQAGCGYVV